MKNHHPQMQRRPPELIALKANDERQRLHILSQMSKAGNNYFTSKGYIIPAKDTKTLPRLLKALARFGGKAL